MANQSGNGEEQARAGHFHGKLLGLAAVCALALVWAGDHWPSDVLGGFLLGFGWSALVMWLPERWLPPVPGSAGRGKKI